MSSESNISLLCECPYAGKTRQIKSSPETEAKRKEYLRHEILKTKEDLIISRNVLMTTRRQLAALQRVLGLEMGWILNPYLTSSSWKDRAREKAYLKSELIHLVDHLRQCDPRYVSDPFAKPTRLSASTEDLLLETHEMRLKHVYHDYTVYHSGNEKRMGASLSNFLKLKENYEKRLYCNKIMQQEIAAVKNKIINLQRQFLEDKNMIDYITEHYFTMKGTFLDVFPPKKGSSDTDSHTVNEGDKEVEKYKTLWEQSMAERKRLAMFLEALKKRLEFVDQKIIRTEMSCSENIVSFRYLAKKLKDHILLYKMLPKRKDEFGKFSSIQYRSQKNQLDAAIKENQYLRNFLRQTVLSKTENLKQFRNSLQSTAGKYRVVLEDIRNKSLPPPPPPVVEETKSSKKKKK